MEINDNEIILRMLMAHHNILRELVKELKIDTVEKKVGKKNFEEVDTLIQSLMKLKQG